MLHGRIPLTILATALLSAVMALPAQAAPVFPDLQTFEPRELQFQERDTLEETEPCPPADAGLPPARPEAQPAALHQHGVQRRRGQARGLRHRDQPGPAGLRGAARSSASSMRTARSPRPRTSAASTGTPPTRTTTSTTGAATSCGPRPTTTPGAPTTRAHPGHEDEAIAPRREDHELRDGRGVHRRAGQHAVPRPLPVRRLHAERRRPDEAGPVPGLGRHLRLLPRGAVDRPRSGRLARQRAGPRPGTCCARSPTPRT